MKLQRLKKLLIITFSLAVFVALISSVNFVKAAVMVTYAGLSAVPNPIGIFQSIRVTVWIWPIPPTISDVYHNTIVKITKPDGTTVTMGPFSSSPGFGFMYFDYIPNQVGNYQFQASYAGETLASTGNNYLPSNSPTQVATVQAGNVSRVYIEPNATINSISPSPVAVGQPTTFSGNGIDADGFIVGYIWTSSIDGVLNRDNTFTMSNLSVGIHRISFQVQDNDTQWSFPAVRSLTVSANQIPTATIDSILPNPAKAGQLVTFIGHGNDTDGFIIGYNWTSSIDGLLSTSRNFSRSNLTEGTHTIYFRVQDNNGAWSNPVSTPLIIQHVNQIPTATIDSILPNPANVSQQVTFSGHGNDTDGFIIGYNWTSSINGTLSTSRTFSTSNLRVGNHIIYFRVQDNNGSWSSPVSTSLVILPTNQIPNATIDSILPNPANTGQLVTFIGHGNDTDGFIIGYNWTSSIDRLLSTSRTFSISNLTESNHTIYFRVQDNNGSWSSPVSTSLVVRRINQIPTATINSILPNPANESQLVTFIGHGNDTDGSIIGYRWTSSINGTLSTSRTFSTSNLKVGNHIIYFQVQDNNMNWSVPDTRILVVEPRQEVGSPTAYIDSIRPNPAAFREQVTFIGHGSDPGGFIVGYRWTSSIDGWLSGSSSFSTSSLSVGTHIITFEVQDNNNTWSKPVSASLEVGPKNLPPSAVIDSSLPSSIAFGQQVTFSGHGDDADGVIVGYRWTSSLDGLLSTSREFSTTSLSVGTHTISFQAQDNSGTWSDEVRIVLEVKEAITLFWYLIVVGGLMGVAAGAFSLVFSLVHFSRPPVSTEVKRSLQKEQDNEAKKEEEEKKKGKREVEKGKPYLDLKTDSPSRIMGTQSYEARIKVKNIGPGEARDITVTADSTPGLQLDKPTESIRSLEPGGERVLVFPFRVSEQVKKGVYALSFEVRSKDTWKQVRKRYARAVKIGLLSNAGRQECVAPLMEWLRGKSFTCDELASADHLVKCLLKYDLIILAPELELPPQWMRNLASFVENNQSLLAIDKMVTSEEKLLAELLGYAEMRYKTLESDEKLLRICDNEHFITRELAVGEGIQLEELSENVCTSQPSTGKSLTEHDVVEGSEKATVSALTINEFMEGEGSEGRTAHLNFHAEKSLSQLSLILVKTLDWLLFEETLTPPKPWSSGLLSLKLAPATLKEQFLRS